MVGLEGEASNTLFETLAEWNSYPKVEDIDRNGLEIQPDIKHYPIRRGHHYEADRYSKNQGWRWSALQKSCQTAEAAKEEISLTRHASIDGR